MFDITGDCNVHCDTCGKIIPMARPSACSKVEIVLRVNPWAGGSMTSVSFDFCSDDCMPEYIKNVVMKLDLKTIK